MAKRFDLYCERCDRPIATRRRGVTYRVGNSEIVEFARDWTVIKCSCGMLRQWRHGSADTADGADDPTVSIGVVESAER